MIVYQCVPLGKFYGTVLIRRNVPVTDRQTRLWNYYYRFLIFFPGFIKSQAKKHKLVNSFNWLVVYGQLKFGITNFLLFIMENHIFIFFHI